MSLHSWDDRLLMPLQQVSSMQLLRGPLHLQYSIRQQAADHAHDAEGESAHVLLTTRALGALVLIFARHPSWSLLHVNAM